MGGGSSRPKIPKPPPPPPPVAVREIEEIGKAKKKVRKPKGGRESQIFAGQMTQLRKNELSKILG